MWLIFSSAIIFSAFRPQKVVVELNPIILNSNSMMLSIKEDEGIKVNTDDGSLYVETPTSGISALLAIPDKVASLMFNFMDGKLLRSLTGQANTVPLDLIACLDPRYAAGLVNMLALDWALGISMMKDDSIEAFSARVDAFEKCYDNGFDGWVAFGKKVGENFVLMFSPRSLAEAAGRSLEFMGKFGALVWLAINFTHLGRAATLTTIGFALLGAIGDKTWDLLTHFGDKAFINCGQFEDAFRMVAKDIAKQCAQILNQDIDPDTYANAVLACLKNPESSSNKDSSGKNPCLDLKKRTLEAMEKAKQWVDKQMNISSDTPVKNFLAGVVSDVKSWWFENTYMEFPLKFDLLAKGQGIVLAILAGAFPFVAVLSVIPTGRSFMNWHLLLNFMVAYFMVKLWIPLLFFIVSVAGHRLAAITGGLGWARF
ncbi:MAG: hypothetical protein JHC21_00585, partial [Thermocrinis sp.]|nr:hypothetical protein [Thermocrinis sp.]